MGKPARFVEFSFKDKMVEELKEFQFRHFIADEDRLPVQEINIGELPEASKFQKVTRKTYDRVNVMDDSGWVRHFYINREDAELALPFIDSLVFQRTKTLEKKIEVANARINGLREEISKVYYQKKMVLKELRLALRPWYRKALDKMKERISNG